MSELRPLPPLHGGKPLAPQAPGGQAPAAPPAKPAELELEPIGLVDAPAGQTGSGISKIKAFGIAGPGSHKDKFARQTKATGTGAIRVRTFHGRLSDEGMAYMDEKINEWLDQHPEIEVKFATTNIGQYEGKIREMALIVNVWY
jgi:hypothetical protein